MQFEQVVFMTPAYDKRHEDPSRNYGIGGVRLFMVLKGPHGAVSFCLHTAWYLPDVNIAPRAPMPAWLGYHSPKPMHENQASRDDACQWIGCQCYSDGSVGGAEKVFDALVANGSDGAWSELERYYHRVFVDGD